jgi:hypothetical protein
MRNREIKFLGKVLKKRLPEQDNSQYFEEMYQEYSSNVDRRTDKYGFFIMAINELSRLGSKADDELVKAVAEIIDGYRQNANSNRAFWIGARNAIERDERLLKFFPKGFLEGLLDSGILDQGLRDQIIKETAVREITAREMVTNIEQNLPNDTDHHQTIDFAENDEDRSYIESLRSELESNKDALLELDNLSIPCIKGNVNDPKEKKSKFPGIENFGNLPIELYDEKGLIDLQKQINETSSLPWHINGRCEHPDRKGHEALISYSFDGTHYRVIIAQQGRVSVNFVSPEYMQSQSQQLEKITSEIRSEISHTEYGDNIDKIALSHFYQNKLAEINKASEEVVVNTKQTQQAILDQFGGDNSALEHLISATSPAPINLNGSGYSIARQATTDGNNIRITHMSDKDGNFRDNVMYANVTGTNFYVKIQVARGDEPENKIDGHECKKGDIIIFSDLYSEPKMDGVMPKDRKLSDQEKEALENCHIIASAMIRDNSDEVQISCSVKFKGKINRQQIKKENKKDVLVSASKSARNVGGDFTTRQDDDEIIML